MNRHLPHHLPHQAPHPTAPHSTQAVPQHSPWFTTFRPVKDPAVRLICLPYAGVGASAFRDWAKPAAKAGDMELVAVRLPGRENRLGEACATSIAAVLPALAAALTPLLDRPFILFGHSLGALIAYELAQVLTAQGRAPGLLAVSGSRAPYNLRRGPAYHHLNDEDFHRALVHLGGTPAEVLGCPDMMAMLTPILRADFRMAESYLRSNATAVTCPLLAFSGRHDPVATPADVEAWRALAADRFTHVALPGDHFFLHRHRSLMIETLVDHSHSHTPKPSSLAQNINTARIDILHV